MKASNFDENKYHDLVEKFGKCRKNVNHYEIYEKLKRVKPNHEIPYDLEYHLKKYCKTNPSSTWGRCVNPAKLIWELLFNP